MNRAAAQIGDLVGDDRAEQLTSAIQLEVRVRRIEESRSLGASIEGHRVAAAVENLKVAGHQRGV